MSYSEELKRLTSPTNEKSYAIDLFFFHDLLLELISDLR